MLQKKVQKSTKDTLQTKSIILSKFLLSNYSISVKNYLGCALLICITKYIGRK